MRWSLGARDLYHLDLYQWLRVLHRGQACSHSSSNAELALASLLQPVTQLLQHLAACGFGFVEMPNSDEGNTAIDKVNNTEIVDRAVRVNEAQERPREHRDLIVRVAGYSAYFTELNRNTQNEIIARTEYTEY